MNIDIGYRLSQPNFEHETKKLIKALYLPSNLHLY